MNILVNKAEAAVEIELVSAEEVTAFTAQRAPFESYLRTTCRAEGAKRFIVWAPTGEMLAGGELTS